MHTAKAVALSLALVCSTGQMLAASFDWAAVQKVQAGQRVEVQLNNGKMLRGRLDSITTESVSLQTSSQTSSVSKNEISRFYVVRGRKWTTPVLIGAGAGAAAAGIAAPRIMEHEAGYGGAVAGAIALGAVIGSGVGYLTKGSSKRLVYENSTPARNSSHGR